MMRKLLLSAVACAFACVCASAAMAQQYKWTDKDGRTQYGDNPPPGVEATRIKGPSGPSPAPSAPASGSAAGSKDVGKDGKPLSPEAAFRKRQQEQAEAEKKDAEKQAQAEVRRKNCESAQASLRQLESGQRIGQVNAQGERVFMEDDQRAKATQSAQKAVSDWCS
jgi:hypothetical protein